MQNQSFNPFLVMLLLAALVVIGVLVKNNSQLKNQFGPKEVQVLPSENNGSQNISYSWDQVDPKMILGVLSSSTFSLDFSPQFVRSFDITSDGIPDALYSGNEGNSEVATIFIGGTEAMGPNGARVAYMKQKDGVKIPVTLVGHASAATSSSYKVDEEKGGFYTINRLATGQDGVYDCGVEFFQWNNSEKSFNWLKSLSKQEAKDICK